MVGWIIKKRRPSSKVAKFYLKLRIGSTLGRANRLRQTGERELQAFPDHLVFNRHRSTYIHDEDVGEGVNDRGSFAVAKRSLGFERERATGVAGIEELFVDDVCSIGTDDTTDTETATGAPQDAMLVSREDVVDIADVTRIVPLDILHQGSDTSSGSGAPAEGSDRLLETEDSANVADCAFVDVGCHGVLLDDCEDEVEVVDRVG